MQSARSSLSLLAVDAAELLLNDRNEGVDDRLARVVKVESSSAAAAAHQRPRHSTESSSSYSGSLRKTDLLRAEVGGGERDSRVEMRWMKA